MSSLMSAILTYEELLGKEYQIEFNNKVYKLCFKRENIKHILGIHKLTDIKNIKKIQSGRIKSSDNNLIITLEKSDKIFEIDERLLNFRKIYKIFNLPNYCKSTDFKIYNSWSKIKSDIIFILPIINNVDQEIVFHTKIEEDKLIPVSFYIENRSCFSMCKKNNVYSVKIIKLK